MFLGMELGEFVIATIIVIIILGALFGAMGGGK